MAPKGVWPRSRVLLLKQWDRYPRSTERISCSTYFMTDSNAQSMQLRQTAGTLEIFQNQSRLTAFDERAATTPRTLSCLLCTAGLPPEMYAVWEAYPWRFGEPYCLFKTFLTEMTTTASVLTISAFTVERYLAICHPLRAQTAYRLERATRVIVIIWLVACAASIPFPVNTRAFHYVADPRDGMPLADSFVCNIPADRMTTMKTVFLVYTFALFVVPMLAIVGLYAAIGLTLRRRVHLELATVNVTRRSGHGNLRRPTRIEMTAMNGRYRQTINRLSCRGRRRDSVSVYISGRQAVLRVLGL